MGALDAEAEQLQAERLPVVRNTPAEIKAARLTVCGHAETGGDAAETLFALGIHPRSKPPRGRHNGDDTPPAGDTPTGRRPNNPDRPPPVHRDSCGSNKGYSAHLYWGDEPCQPCRVAHREHQREWKAHRAVVVW
jgi:hypothetical protein